MKKGYEKRGYEKRGYEKPQRQQMGLSERCGYLTYFLETNKLEKHVTHNCPQEEKIGEAKGRFSKAHFKKE